MDTSLEMKVSTIEAGTHTVTYGFKEAPLDVQEATFAAKNLITISPAELGFLRANGSGIFDSYSRTSAEVFYDDRNNKVIIVPGGAISKLVGIDKLVAGHEQGEEYAIPKDQKNQVYDMVDKMLREGTAFTVNYGKTVVSTSKFGETELTSKLFSDLILGIKAQDYGDWLKSKGRSTITYFFDSEDDAKSKKGPYMIRLRVCGPNFDVNGGKRLYDDLNGANGAFGVRFEKTGH